MKLGTKFRARHADSNAEWVVLSARGADTYNCMIVNDPDWSGTKKVFGGEEIRAYIKRAENFTVMMDEHDKWWSELPLDSIVHYRHGNGAYVRGKIVDHNGEKRMLPTAIVGKHHPMDLPYWNGFGDLSCGVYATWIFEGDHFMQPNISNMYEANPRDDEPDPRPMPALSLDPGLLSEDKHKCRRLNNKRIAIKERLNEELKPDKDGNYSTALEKMLDDIKKILS